MLNPQDTVLDLLYGRWRSQTLYAGVKLGIFECIEHAPVPAPEVARQLGLDSALSYRLLRALGSLGLLHELKATNRLPEAEQLMRQALEICIVSHGPEHPNSRTVARNYVDLLQGMGRTEEEIEGILASLLQRR